MTDLTQQAQDQEWWGEMSDIDVHTGEWVNTPLGPAMKNRPGKISRRRTVLSYDVDYLVQALRHIEKASPSTMIKALAEMREKIDTITKHINEVLNAYGDRDPRHN